VGKKTDTMLDKEKKIICLIITYNEWDIFEKCIELPLNLWMKIIVVDS